MKLYLMKWIIFYIVPSLYQFFTHFFAHIRTDLESKNCRYFCYFSYFCRIILNDFSFFSFFSFLEICFSPTIVVGPRFSPIFSNLKKKKKKKKNDKRAAVFLEWFQETGTFHFFRACSLLLHGYRRFHTVIVLGWLHATSMNV